ncbi:PAS domain S-box-containing protein [Ekhidna lutea]|uniref:histidine kinase n=1 Tax=Ekhidna lutea TaxID=447679 RepID=A0A239KLK3_EKHLU|nr:PAS domain S-box protein [Ekhidna lutea]SNT18469.1 PAS domain S-box-containing protein [Ekhidna lutea]
MAKKTQITHESVLESMPFGVIQVNIDGMVTYANQSAFSLLGIKKSQLIGVHYLDFEWDQFSRNEEPMMVEEHALYKVLNQNKKVTTSIQGTFVKGKRKWFSVNAAPIYDDSDQLIGGVSNFADITQKIEKDRISEKESERFKILIENINAVVWESDLATKTFSYMSPKVEEIFGYPEKKWMEEGFWQSRIYDDDKEHVLAYEKHKASDVSSYQLEYRIRHKDGRLIWIRDLVEVVKVDGKPTSLRGLMLDITEQKNARILLKEREQQYRQLITEAPYAITIYNKEGTLIAANAKCEEYWLINLKDYINQFNIFQNDLFTKDKQVDEIKKAFQGESGEVTTSISLEHAEVDRNFKIKYYPLFDSDGKLENVVYITEDITDRVQAEENIKREEGLKQGILDALDEAILVVDDKGTIINVNKNLTTYIKGQPYSKLEVGKSVFEFTEYFGEENYLKESLTLLMKQQASVIDQEMKLADGKWYNLRATPLSDPFGAVITWQNINTRKEIEMALEKSLRKYRNIYNKAPVMMHSINEKLEIISVSDFWLEKMGYERNEVIGKTPVDFISESSMIDIATNLKKLFKDGYVKNVEYKYRRKSGDEIDVILSAVAEYDEEGNFERSITGMLDVTDLKEAERKLQESQFKLLESQRISKIANYEYDPTTGAFDPSEEMIAMMGFDDSHRHVSIIQELIHPEDLAEFAKKLESCIAEGKDFFHIYRINHLKTKKLKWISGRGKMFFDNGKVTRMIGTVQDITEQKNAEQKIRRLTDRILLATEIANIGVWEYDSESGEIFWEDQMYSIFTNTKKPLSINELKDHFIEDDQQLIDTSLGMIKGGINFLESEVQVKIDSEIKYLRAFTRVLRDHKGKLRGMVGVVYDISVDKKLQKQLETSLEEKNVLIKEVHHRVKNNMQLISSILALKSYELDSEKSKVVFDEINDRIKAMAVIHDKLYTFHNVSEINISEYLNHIAKELQIVLSAAKFKVSVHSEHLVLDVEKALLIGLMVSEMVGNAVKHGFSDKTSGAITIHFGYSDGNYFLRVLNNGEKLNADVLKKETGLGVSLIKTFSKQLGGKVEIDEENGFRASF